MRQLVDVDDRGLLEAVIARVARFAHEQGVDMTNHVHPVRTAFAPLGAS